MIKSLNKADLSPARRDLVSLCQDLNYGYIENLLVRAGEPVLSPPPRRVRSVKFGQSASPRPEAERTQVALPLQFQQLMGFLDRMGTGRIARIDVAAGLPLKLDAVESAA